MMANVLAVFAQFERRLIGQRTREALAVRRSQGVKLGRPRTLPDEVRQRIRAERAGGETLRQIASKLNSERVPTAQGAAQWHPETVRKILAAG
jgi:DNA invertase Pin-like site-specific DNA recombinase